LQWSSADLIREYNQFHLPDSRNCSDELRGREQIGQAHAVRHFSPQAVEHGEPDIGAVLRRIVVDADALLKRRSR
jgi:hypothetical protein